MRSLLSELAAALSVGLGARTAGRSRWGLADGAMITRTLYAFCAVAETGNKTTSTCFRDVHDVD